MSLISTVLGGCLAVSAVGAVWYSRSEPEILQERPPEPTQRIRRAEPEMNILPRVEIPRVEPNLYSEEHVKPGAPQEEEGKEPVQTIEERGDAMLFEIEALSLMPFDQAITMPFD